MIRSLFLSTLLALAAGHAFMTDPPQRGTLGGNNNAPHIEVIDGAPRDVFAHFPAGDKSRTPGSGLRSQEEEGGTWNPYEPLRPGFTFRAGVCGDLKSNPEHLRGGKYYFDGFVTRTYKQGGTLELRQTVIAHHNGFVQLHVCDVKRCDGEISEKCFRDGFCYPLERAPNAECDSGMSKNCGPIDSNNPTRWYLPCTSQVDGEGTDDYLGPFATFKLPDFLTCEHCVLQWFYTAANNCNPTGVVDYFKGPDGPKNWGDCPGQAGAIGGFTDVQNACGEGRPDDSFPEEYYQCADIKIEPNGENSTTSAPTSAPVTTTPATTPTTATTAAATTTTASTTARVTPPPKPAAENPSGSADPFKYFNFIADDKVVQTFTTTLTIDISKYRKVAIEAVLEREVMPVQFYIDGVMVWDENTAPYFLYGNSGRMPRYFNEERLAAVVNRPFELEVKWLDMSIKSVILMTR